jgi:hypothetical protein
MEGSSITEDSYQEVEGDVSGILTGGEAIDSIAAQGDEAFEEVDHCREGSIEEAGVPGMLEEVEFFTSEFLESLVSLF